MLGCIDLNYDPDPDEPSASDTAPNDDKKASNVDAKTEANDSELVALPPTAISQNRPGKCPFKHCISDTFDACGPPATATRRIPPTSPSSNVDQTSSEAILKKMGVLHLDDKLTRPVMSAETEEHVLREAGAALYVQRGDDDDDDGEYEGDNNHQRHNIKYKQLTERETQILKEAGVNIKPIMPCGTATTAVMAASDSYDVTFLGQSPSDEMTNGKSTNPTLTYAEKELLRRLKNGWISNGMHCAECGMPIIFKIDGGDYGLMECVICGVVGVPEEFEAHVAFGGVEKSFSCLDTTITSGFSTMNHDQNNTFLQKSNTNLTPISDDVIKKELGRRIFAGWKVLSSKCPSCNLPLISDGKDCSGVCLRCG
jgi:uncharacterized Zn finger protein (UPF0148 family)